MNLVKWCALAVATFTVSLLSIRIDIECSPLHFDYRLVGKCHDIPEAVNFLNQSLPVGMPLEERCKRYALLSQIHRQRRLPSRLEIFRLSELPAADVDIRFQAIDDRQLSDFYMTAIDGYRAMELAPPVIELYECLRMFDTSYGAMYLKNPELSFTVDLYRRVLESPDGKIDLDLVELRNFYPAFQERIRYLFKDYIRGAETNDSTPTTGCKTRIGRPKKEKRGDVILETSSTTSLRPAVFPRMRELLNAGWTEEQIIGRRRRRKLEVARERSRRLREANPHRHREQERLRQQRLRIMNPDLVRERIRSWERRRRDRRKERQEEQSKEIHERLEKYMEERRREHLRQVMEQEPSIIMESHVEPAEAVEATGLTVSAHATPMTGPRPVAEAADNLEQSQVQHQQPDYGSPQISISVQQPSESFSGGVEPMLMAQQPLFSPSFAECPQDIDPEVGSFPGLEYPHAESFLDQPSYLFGADSLSQETSRDTNTQATSKHNVVDRADSSERDPQAGSVSAPLARPPVQHDMTRQTVGMEAMSGSLDQHPQNLTIFDTGPGLQDPWDEFQWEFSRDRSK